MPKIKTKSLAKKRFKKTATGKIKAAKGFRRHLLTKKSASKKRKLRKANYLTKGDARHIKRLLPNN